VNDAATKELAERLVQLAIEVGRELGRSVPAGAGIHTPFADLLDSMGMVEFLLRVADELGTTAEAIEQAVNRQFGTVLELSAAIHAARSKPRDESSSPGGKHVGPIKDVPAPTAQAISPVANQPPPTGCWLCAASACLPDTVQASTETDRILNRPAGWLEKHAGIRQRRLWNDADPLDVAMHAGRAALEQADLVNNSVNALLVTSEAPPLLAGLAAALHARLGLPAGVPALEVGGACTGFLCALWLGRALLKQMHSVLLLAVEAPSRYLKLEPGLAGEGAALFGDGAAACVLSTRPSGPAVPLVDVMLGADGSLGHLLRVHRRADSDPILEMDGPALAGRAVRTMAHAGRDLLARHGLNPADVSGVVAHGGNGRMPALLARQLKLPPELVWSETASTGNLGSASLPVAWAARAPVKGPVLWTAVGAGLTCGAALTWADR
jgi:3-oxoacyl-[acyl-carrier-protein] synthase-3